MTSPSTSRPVGRVGRSRRLIAQRMLTAMGQPFQLDPTSMPLDVNVSIGIATGDRTTASELLGDADIALYEAKTAGKNRYRSFDPQMKTAISRRTDLERDLHAALGADQYRLVYQPIYGLDGTGMVAVEALLRWDHPTRGLILPATSSRSSNNPDKPATSAGGSCNTPANRWPPGTATARPSTSPSTS